jgi:tripartite-type tricarboxylate transporter receptor subunit TctC
MGMGKVSIVAAIVLALGLAGARAETYPSKPITLIVPFPAGGPTDAIARIISDHMKDTLGQSILVETVTGAGATIGVGRVVNAAPDGYTVGIGNWTSHVGSPALYPVSWNPVNNLEPIARLPVSSLMIVGKEALPVSNAKDLIAWLKANSDKATAASVGSGSGAHVCGLYFGEKTGTKFQFVFYRGGAPAMQDMLAGTIDIMCAEASQTLAHVQAGKMKAFAVMGRTRYAGLPEVPTMDEMGISGMDISFWHGLWGPKGMPKEAVARLNDAVIKALDDPLVQKRVAALGMTIPAKAELTPQALHDYHKAELDKWWPIIKSYGIKAE